MNRGKHLEADPVSPIIRKIDPEAAAVVKKNEIRLCILFFYFILLLLLLIVIYNIYSTS